jgi:hypothetical protein
MTEAEEKAKEIILEFFSVHTTLHCNKGCITIDSIGMDSAKRCALISINQILSGEFVYIDEYQIDYWQDVKREIEKL